MGINRKTASGNSRSLKQGQTGKGNSTTVEQSHELSERELSTHVSDLGNAARFARHHREYLIHVPGIGWLFYGGTRWRPAGADLMRLAKKTVALIYQEINSCPVSQRKELAAWAGRSEDLARITAMLALAECEMSVSEEKLDADPWLFNCLNGTIDLTLTPRTTRLRPHDPADYITKVAPVTYNPNAKSKLFDRVLFHAQPVGEVRAFMQKGAGYTLTGITSEDVFFLLDGVTRSSKGTLQEAFATTLGDYCIAADLDMLAKRDRSGGARPDLVRLRGVRMVAIYETSGKR